MLKIKKILISTLLLSMFIIINLLYAQFIYADAKADFTLIVDTTTIINSKNGIFIDSTGVYQGNSSNPDNLIYLEHTFTSYTCEGNKYIEKKYDLNIPLLSGFVKEYETITVDGSPKTWDQLIGLNNNTPVDVTISFSSANIEKYIKDNNIQPTTSAETLFEFTASGSIVGDPICTNGNKKVNVEINTLILKDNPAFNPNSVEIYNNGNFIEDVPLPTTNYSITVDVTGTNTLNLTARLTSPQGCILEYPIHISTPISDCPTPARTLTIEKSANPISAIVGDIVTFTYTVVYTGPLNTTKFQLIDDKLGTIYSGTTPPPGLVSGQPYTFTKTWIAQLQPDGPDSDSDPDAFVNTATIIVDNMNSYDTCTVNVNTTSTDTTSYDTTSSNGNGRTDTTSYSYNTTSYTYDYTYTYNTTSEPKAVPSRDIKVKDPIIKAKDLKICVNDPFKIMRGVSAFENMGKGKDITNKVTTTGKINTGVEGEYEITYRVKDQYGNRAEEIRTVTIKECESLLEPEEIDKIDIHTEPTSFVEPEEKPVCCPTAIPVCCPCCGRVIGWIRAN